MANKHYYRVDKRRGALSDNDQHNDANGIVISLAANPTANAVVISILTASILSSVATMWSFNERLARIEERLVPITKHYDNTFRWPPNSD
jgi:hypothetical protein